MRFIKWLVFILVIPLAVYAGLLYQNNRSADALSKVEMQRSLDSGISWLFERKEKILNEANPMLWWMLQQSAEISGDPRLKELFAGYETRYLKNNRKNIWRPLFYKNTWSPVRYESIRDFPYYNKHFLYALSCDKDLEQHAEIREQNQPEFCNSHPLRPACVTHQLMGIRILQRKKCGDTEKLRQMVSVLQGKIENQLFYDPRVVDVYLQRVLMLIETGTLERVKPIWLIKVFKAQSDEGGWSNFEPLFPLYGGQSLGFSQHGVSIRTRRDGFHTTAQGVMIMSLLLAEK